jgi:hypothetical protein
VRRSTSTVGLAVALATLAGCTVVTPGNGGDDGGTKIIVIPVRPDALPPPSPISASVLYVANLQRSSTNLADAYARIILGITAYLDSKGVKLENMGLIATYSDEFGPRLLLGRRAGAQPSSSLSLLAALGAAADAGVTDYMGLLPFIGGALANVSDEDLPRALKLLASSGRFDGTPVTPEAQAVIEFGKNLNALALPPELGGIDRMALFDRPRDLFLVVYLQPLPRRCALGTAACLVDERDPAQIFLETNPDGTAAWLSYTGAGMRPDHIVQVAIATSEGEDISTFHKRCADLPGFPPNLFDVIAPSPNAYFGPLIDTLNSAHRGTGQRGDFCELVGSDTAIQALGQRVASLAVTH